LEATRPLFFANALLALLPELLQSSETAAELAEVTLSCQELWQVVRSPGCFIGECPECFRDKAYPEHLSRLYIYKVRRHRWVEWMGFRFKKGSISSKIALIVAILPIIPKNN
jgi:hypothetical protein